MVSGRAAPSHEHDGSMVRDRRGLAAYNFRHQLANVLQGSGELNFGQFEKLNYSRRKQAARHRDGLGPKKYLRLIFFVVY